MHVITRGKYYLVDAEFMLRSTLLAPYRGVRYHLKEYSRNPPQNPKELFNLRHVSLRNVIERAFVVLKKRFPIIASSNEPSYRVQTQKKMILVCCILRNDLIAADPDDGILHEVDEEILNNPELHEQLGAQRVRNNDDAAQGEILRNSIATGMWRDYTSNPT
nr:uncharacterized protein LOC112026451 [Quercus suber]